MACGELQNGSQGHLDFDGLTLAGVGPLAFQGLTCGGDCLLMAGSRLARGRARPDTACRLGGTVKSTVRRAATARLLRKICS